MSQACSDSRLVLTYDPGHAQAAAIAQTACSWKPKAAAKSVPEKMPEEVAQAGARSGKDFLSSKVADLRMKAAGNNNAQAGQFLNDRLLRLAQAKAEGNFLQVLSEANEALILWPHNVDILCLKAFAQNRNKDYKEALATAEEAIKADPMSAAAYANKAYALGALGDREGMLAALREAARLDPRFEEALQRVLASAGDAASLFDFPGEARRSPTTGNNPGEGGGLKAETVKWMVIGILGLSLAGLIVFLIGRNTRGKTAPPRPRAAAPAVANGASLAPGLLQGKFQIGAQIGAGGMGVVFEGKDLSLDRKIAVKKMLPQLAAQPKLRERFVAEAKTVAALHHPSIVGIHAIVEENQDLYLVFEHVAGQTLAELIAGRGRYPFPEALRIIRDIAAAVEFAHGQDIIHRDLKPSNVMIDATGRVVVMDFGLARTVRDLISEAALTNTVVGTPAYMAPEQEDGVICKQSDVYSLAVCLYEMLSAQRPFDGAPGAMMASKAALKYTRISKLVAGLPAGMDIFFNCAFAVDPKKRPASPKEFVAALDSMTPVPASR